MFARDQQTIPFIEQWERANRWFAKVEVAYRDGTHADEMMDLFFVTFQNLFCLRDWFLSSGLDKDKVNTLFSKKNLRLCRDIANGTKHCAISRASVDANFRTFREYDPTVVKIGFARVEVFRVHAHSQTYDMYGLLQNCFTDVQEFLIQEGLLAARSALKCDMMAAASFNPNTILGKVDCA